MRYQLKFFLVLLALFAVFFSCSAQTPAWQWANSAGGGGFEQGNSIAAADSGNTYVTGAFLGEAAFADDTLTSNTPTFEDIFLAKYDANGQLVWANRAGGASYDYGRGIAVDAAGNCYVTGSFEGTADFGDTSLIAGSGFPAMFIVKYLPDGSLDWGLQLSGTNLCTGNAIAVDDTGNCYVTGHFGGMLDFGDSSFTSFGNYDVLTAKFDPAGQMLWVRQAGGSSFDFGEDIAVHSSGFVQVTGYFANTAEFNTNFILPSNGVNDIFIARYGPSGGLHWARKAGSPSDDRGYGIDVDAAGYIYITGEFEDTAQFGDSSLVSTATAGKTNCFVAKYNPNGIIEWARQAGGTADDDKGLAIAVEGTGEAYVTGYFGSTTAVFGSDTLFAPAGSDDVFVAKYDASGEVLWAQQAGGTTTDRANGIAVDPAGAVYTVGTFTTTANFGATPLSSAGEADIFVAKLVDSTITANSPHHESTRFQFYPNPTNGAFTVEAGKGQKTLRMFDLHGSIVFERTFRSERLSVQTQELPNGVYLLQLQQGAQYSTRRLLIR